MNAEDRINKCKRLERKSPSDTPTIAHPDSPEQVQNGVPEPFPIGGFRFL
jgi:hypothetical protein